MAQSSQVGASQPEAGRASGGSGWYQDPDVLLMELQRCRARARRAPQIAGYDEIREISRGGQGEVFSAIHRSLSRRVAVKIVAARALHSEQHRQRFEREIDLVSGLQHPNIVRVYDRGVTSDERQYFAMEYVEGRTLDEWLRQDRVAGGAEASGKAVGGGRHTGIERLLRMFGRICDAVSFAHQRGIIHRDIKPTNIIIDGEGEPHVLDFGLAKEIDSTLGERGVTRTGEFMGTLAYASPEQLSGDPQKVDIRTDVYSLGAVLYEMVSGRPPFSMGVPLGEAIKAIMEDEPVAPSRAAVKGNGKAGGRAGSGSIRLNRRSSARRDLDAVILKALAKQPEQRYQSAAALRDDVQRYVEGEPVDARRQHAVYVLGKLVRRHRVAAGAIAAGLVVLLGGSAGVSLMYRQMAEKEKLLRVFWEDTLGSVSPAGEQKDVALGEVLDEAVRWIDLVAADPEMESALRTTIGNSYRSLGRFEEAEGQLRTALDSRRARFGEESLEAAQGLNALGLLRRDQGALEEAERLFQEALAIRRRELGGEDLEVAQSLQNLGILSMRAGELDEAESRIGEAMEIRRAQLGDSHVDVAMCRYQLAEIARERGDLVASEGLHRNALDARRSGLHPRHPDLARSLLALGRVLNESGGTARAEPLLRECVGIMHEAGLGESWRAAEAEGELGSSLLLLERFEEAEQALLRSYGVLRLERGETDALTRLASRRLAELYATMGRAEEAERFRAAAGE